MKKIIYSLIILITIGGAFYWVNTPSESPGVSFGAIGTPTSLTTGNDVDGNSTATTASVSPSANNLLLLNVVSRTAITVNPNEPTITGNGLTWVAINTVVYDDTSSTRRRVTLFRSMGSSPSTGTISIDFGGQSQTDVLWSLDQISGVDTSGTNGSGAIVQNAVNSDKTATTNTITITLGAFSSTDNITYGAFGFDGGAPLTVGSGFTSTASLDSSANALQLLSEYKLSNDTTVEASSNANGNLGGVAIEIKSAVSTPAITSDLIMFE